MKTRLNRFIIFLAVLGLLFGPAGSAPASAAEIQASAYGYTLESGNFAASWIDLSSLATPKPTQLTFISNDDSYTSSPVAIGFSFPYFENNYAQVYVGTNGMLMFTNPVAVYTNQPIPFDVIPNNYIAPFWDDLRIAETTSSKVYAVTTGSYPNRVFIVQWNKVLNLAGGGTNTFQVKLHESGKIEFNYQTMGSVLNECTVGIEDADGVDGLQVYFNQAGLANNRNFTFSRPTGNSRFKALPLYQAGFLRDGQVNFPIEVRNTGLVNDTYNLSHAVLNSTAGTTWKVRYYRQDNGQLLQDTDGNGKVDTGEITPGGSFKFIARVQMTSVQTPGHYGLLEIRMSAVGFPGVVGVRVQAAVPAFFTQLFTDSVLGVNVEHFFPTQSVVRPVVGYYSGASQSLAGISDSRYILAWEKAEQGGSSNLQYVISDAFSFNAPAVRQFTSYTSSPPYIADVSPSMAATPDGVVGLAFKRDAYLNDEAEDYVSNIYLARLDQAGNLIAGSNNPRKLSSNTLSRYQSNGRELTSPKVVALDNNRFVVVWVQINYLPDDERTEDLWMAVVGSNNTVIVPARKLTSSTTTLKYSYPTPVAMKGGKLLLAYGVRSSNIGNNELGYRFYDTFEGTSWWLGQSEEVVSGTSIYQPDAVQIRPSNRVIVAWQNALTQKIAYVIISNNGSTLVAGPADLENPDLRPMDYVSVTHDNYDHAILTWRDSSYLQSLYYALVNKDGGVVTPVMPFRRGVGSYPLIFPSRISGGNAALLIDKITNLYMPMIDR